MSLLKQMLWKCSEWIMYMDLVLMASEDGPLCGKPPHCCKGYQVNNSNCLPGYHGEECQLPCRFPSYGEHCQSFCACKEEQCHFINGCVNSSRINRKNQQNDKNSDGNSTPSDDRKENRNTQEDENISMTETTPTRAEYSRRTSDQVFMSTFAVQDENVPFLQHLQQHLPLYVCFVIIFLSVSLNVFFIVRLLKNKRRIVKERSVGKNEDTNEDEYVNIRSQLRSDFMYTNMQRKQGASYIEIEEINMRSMHGVPPL
ncbi:uncharacterized protein LOC111104617 [Crassostrea virginica]